MKSNKLATTDCRRTRNTQTWAVSLAALALGVSACGVDRAATAVDARPATTASAAAETTAAAATLPATTAAVTSVPLASVPVADVPTTVLSPDAQLAATALIVPSDLGGPWRAAPPRLRFPNGVRFARPVPSCAEFVETTFSGGSKYGANASTALVSGNAHAVFSYVVIFPTVDEAKALIAGMSTPAFDHCWADFNVSAEMAILPGATAAEYTSVAPPVLTIHADSFTVKSLVGTVTVGGNKVGDTCICAFSQVGRGVVGVHSGAAIFDPAERSKVVQIAIDKLRTTLAA